MSELLVERYGSKIPHSAEVSLVSTDPSSHGTKQLETFPLAAMLLRIERHIKQILSALSMTDLSRPTLTGRQCCEPHRI